MTARGSAVAEAFKTVTDAAIKEMERSEKEDFPIFPAHWYYLSFADDDGFLGAVYARGISEADAWARASVLGLNPGGEVLFVGPLPEDRMDANVPDADRWRLLVRDEITEGA